MSARLLPASASAGTCLLILHPPGEPPSGAGRVYVEYRIADGWDAGMDPLGPSLSREAVVVHSEVDQPSAGPRAFYRGCIPTVSIDSDVAVAMTPLVVHRDGLGPNGDWVEVSVAVGTLRGVEIVRGYHSDDMVSVVGQLQTSTTLCGDTIRKGRFRNVDDQPVRGAHDEDVEVLRDRLELRASAGQSIAAAAGGRRCRRAAGGCRRGIEQPLRRVGVELRRVNHPVALR